MSWEFNSKQDTRWNKSGAGAFQQACTEFLLELNKLGRPPEDLCLIVFNDTSKKSMKVYPLTSFYAQGFK